MAEGCLHIQLYKNKGTHTQQEKTMRSITCKMFISLVVVYGFCLNVSLQLCTPSDTNTIICDDEVPVTLPSDVTRVYLSISSFDFNFDATTFSHRSWENVTTLDITAQYKNEYGDIEVTFGSMCFGQLNALEELRFHGDEIDKFSVDSFDKVEHLQELKFSDCNYLNINTIIGILNDKIKVKALSLEDVSGANVAKINLNELFYERLHTMKVTSLSLRKTIFKVNLLLPRQIKTTDLETLDISQTVMLLPDKIRPNILYDMHAPFLQGVKTLNISAIPMQFFLPDNDFLNNRIIRNCDELRQGMIQHFYLRVENLYSDALFLLPVIMNNTLLNISDCHFNLRKWHFKANKLQYFNMSIYLPLNNTLTEVDFSNNEIKYVSPLAFQNAKALEILNLRSNDLFYMQALPDFNDLLVTLNALKHFCVAENKISNLPRGIFRNNVALEIIDLSDNHLKSILFTLKHLQRLKSLNIARNRIKMIEGEALTDIQLFFESRAFAGSNNTTVIEMTGNPFECSCDSVKFMEWIISLEQHRKRKYVCFMENEKTEINRDSLLFSKYLCYRTVIITCACIGIVILIAVVILLTILLLRRKRKQKEKCERKHFLKDFQKGVLKEQYLCQISYSSEDEICALDIIYTSLNIALNRKCPCKREIICTGDKNFCLGRSIVDEILRCISESCVIVFVISKSFCGSRWCEMELREAYEMGKPIILIFKEEVKTDIMSKLLLTVFNRITRAKLIENEGRYTLVPDWESLGEAVIKLATEQFIAEQATL